ncbi:MAG: glycosyltransferase family 4 protein [Bacteroidetes bacterium]|nr:glycosyltransferase family 4 protein [Bacteroidota bacterium]MCL5030243.1 glycosyltransferase family 4 protein [Bacteroidota bacterium]
MKKKILHLNTNLDVTSGITRHIELLCRGLSEDYEQHVMAFKGDTDKKFEPDIALHINKIDMPRIIRKLIMPLIIWRYIKKHNIEVVHSHHRYMDLVASLIPGIRTITTVHSKVGGKNKMSYKAREIIAVSESIRKHLINYYGIKDDCIRLLYYFIDSDTMVCTRDKTDLRFQLGIGKDDFLLGYIGRIDYGEKGIDLLISAYEKLRRRTKNLKLVLIGNGKELNAVAKLNAELQLGLIILKSTGDIFNYFQCIDLFILPSRIDPFPYVMMEAAAMKIPIVASRVDGIPEFIEDGVNGLLFEKDNVDDLISRIELMMSNDRLRNEYSQRLYSKVMANYEKKITLSNYAKLYSGESFQ